MNDYQLLNKDSAPCASHEQSGWMDLNAVTKQLLSSA